MEDSGQANRNQTGRSRTNTMKTPETRYVEGSTSMARAKRRLDSASSEQGQPEKKRPTFASVIVEAVKVDSRQKFCSSLEPILRRVVREEVERALAKSYHPKLIGRSPPKQIEGPGGRNLQLNFSSRLSLPLFTGGKVEGEQGAAVHVVLTNSVTGHIITTGPEASARLDVVVLEGDFNHEDDETWSEEDFNSHLVKEREGKRPLLAGDLQVTLHEGVGTLREFIFTDNSSWIRSRKFRLGLKVSSGSCEGVRIREAKTEAFTVRDHRGELYKKHYPPALRDEVWRLEKIGKDGSFHKRLSKARIFTVEDFLRLMVRDSQGLRSVLGSGMSNKMWDALVEHSRTCVLSGKHYVYYPNDDRSVGVAFNHIHELTGLITNGQYYSADSLPQSQKDSLVKAAYENWGHVVEFEDQSFLNPEPEKSLCNLQIDVPMGPQVYTNLFDQQFGLHASAVPVHSDRPTLNSGLPGYEQTVHTMSARYSVPSQNSNLNTAQHHFDSSLFALQNQNQLQQRNGNDNFALGPTQLSTSGYHYHHHNSFLPEETRMRSHETLESDEMFIRMFNSPNIPEDQYNMYSSAHLSYNFDDFRSRSGKAIIGWLKLKAALRWGIFIRKKAAERRAQLVELDDI